MTHNFASPVPQSIDPAIGPPRVRRSLAAVAALALWLTATAALAQGEAAPELKKPPKPPESLDLNTKDGLQLKATFYPSGLGRDAVPVLLLHGFKGKRSDFEPLALALQLAGHAVLVPDLRGHGDSITVEGAPRELEADTLPPAQYGLMITYDLESCKKYLMGLHNKGDLNIEKLCVVGADMGAVLGAFWTKLDWGWPPLATGKQGQDVRALVLLSPPWAFKTLKMNDALADPQVRKQISIFIAVGENKKDSARDAQRIFDLLSPHHPDPPEDKQKELKDLFYQKFKTSLQGTKLLTETPNLAGQIARFIELRLVDKEIPWKARKLPLQD